MSSIFDPAVLLEVTSASGLAALFVCVFLDQAGLPLPAFPPIMAATAVANIHHRAVWPILVVTALAALAADFVWYVGGRRFGPRLVRLACTLSLTPDACVASTRDTYARWGPASLVIAKFIPGFAALATTLAGETRVPSRTFLAFDGLGALAWAGLAVALGVLFDDTIRDLLRVVHALGGYAAFAVAIALVSLVAWKMLRRRWLGRANAISVGQLHRALLRAPVPVVVDARSRSARAIGNGIPAAVSRDHLLEASRETDIVVYCDCPDDAGARATARELRQRGFTSVRVLSGGLRAWQQAATPSIVAHPFPS